MRRVGLFALAFAAMIGVAAAAMVRFTGPRPARPSVVDKQAPAPAADRLILPVAGARWSDVRDSWGDARDGGERGHTGTDILAPAGTPVVAAAAGIVEKLFDSRAGGHTIYIRSPDRLWSYYYAHLAGYAPGLAEGAGIKAGEPLAYVGDTGNAGAGNYHLHFGISRMRPDERWYQGTAVNPYPLLAAAQGRR